MHSKWNHVTDICPMKHYKLWWWWPLCHVAEKSWGIFVTTSSELVYTWKNHLVVLGLWLSIRSGNAKIVGFIPGISKMWCKNLKQNSWDSLPPPAGEVEPELCAQPCCGWAHEGHQKPDGGAYHRSSCKRDQCHVSWFGPQVSLHLKINDKSQFKPFFVHVNDYFCWPTSVRILISIRHYHWDFLSIYLHQSRHTCFCTAIDCFFCLIFLQSFTLQAEVQPRQGGHHDCSSHL